MARPRPRAGRTVSAADDGVDTLDITGTNQQAMLLRNGELWQCTGGVGSKQLDPNAGGLTGLSDQLGLESVAADRQVHQLLRHAHIVRLQSP